MDSDDDIIDVPHHYKNDDYSEHEEHHDESDQSSASASYCSKSPIQPRMNILVLRTLMIHRDSNSISLRSLSKERKALLIRV